MIDTTQEPSGFHILTGYTGQPDAKGVLTEVPLNLPATRSICHFAAYQRHDPVRMPRTDQAIGGGANRVQGLRIERWSEAIEGGLYAILELTDGDWMVLLPIAGRESMAWLKPTGDGVAVRIGTLGTDPVTGELPVLAWSRGANLYQACEAVWKLALTHPLMRGIGRLREQKPYPEIFNYLGWCSWEQYKRKISAELLIDAAEQINAGELPIRYMLVDDGYLIEKENALMDLGANPQTFPDGWSPLLSQRCENGLRWFGLWQNFNGYWKCIDAGNDLSEEMNGHLMDVPQGGRLPKATLLDAVAWYEAMVAVARDAGFDFIKVDNQANNLHNYEGTGNAVQAAFCSSQAFERAGAAQVNGVINCMAHGPVNVFNTPLSAVTRCSEDYEVNNAWRAKAHLHNSYQNMLWLGATIWGDHDMFHSSDTFAGRMMAVSKAMSGGPVYLSDAPSDFNPAVVQPLCDSDARLYRPLAPAVPLTRCAMLDPFDQAEPYIVAAPLGTGAAAIVAYNFTEPTQPVSGAIVAADYLDAAGLLDAAWPEADEGLILYDWYRQEAVVLQDAWPFQLAGFEDCFVLLCPIRQGWAVIGRTDKYLSPATIEVLHITTEGVLVDSEEACELVLWHDSELLKVSINAGTTFIPKSGCS